MNGPARFLRDFYDGNARPRPGESFADLLKVGIPLVLGGIAPIVGPLSDLLDQLPGAARAIRLAVPLALLALCLHLVRDQRIVARAAGFGSGEGEREYRFGQPSRIAAKAALLPLVALASFQAYSGAPAWLFGRSALSGYICLADGAPAGRSTSVEAVDSDGETVSRQTVTVDDNGYFVLAYRPWARRAASLALGGTPCGGRSLPLAAATQGLHCPADRLLPPSERSSRPLWTAPCAR